VIKENIFSVGVSDPDRKLFDELIPLPNGTTYNSFLIKGSEKTVLVDTVDPEKKDILLKNLNDIEKIDYIIAHHAEQDHSGALPDIIAKHKDAKVICSERCKNMVMDIIHIP
jgi:flavorubredoxin